MHVVSARGRWASPPWGPPWCLPGVLRATEGRGRRAAPRPGVGATVVSGGGSRLWCGVLAAASGPGGPGHWRGWPELPTAGAGWWWWWRQRPEGCSSRAQGHSYSCSGHPGWKVSAGWSPRSCRLQVRAGVRHTGDPVHLPLTWARSACAVCPGLPGASVDGTSVSPEPESLI